MSATLETDLLPSPPPPPPPPLPLAPVDSSLYQAHLEGLARVVESMGETPAPLMSTMPPQRHAAAAKVIAYYAALSLPEYQALQMEALTVSTAASAHHSADKDAQMLVQALYDLLRSIDVLLPGHALPVYYVIKKALAQSLGARLAGAGGGGAAGDDTLQPEQHEQQQHQQHQQQIEELLGRVWSQASVQVALLSVYGGVEPLMQMLTSDEPLSRWQVQQM
ncbi:hypothetical protein RI367_006835 [Sorochytrium milnesiophthora]